MSSNVSLKISERATDNEKVSVYIQQLTEQQKIVLNIAKEHLATSFCIEKSLGYLNWLKTQTK
jgi:hypothetical protein